MQHGLNLLQMPREMRALSGNGTTRREYSCPPNVQPQQLQEQQYAQQQHAPPQHQQQSQMEPEPIPHGVQEALEEHQAAAPLAGFRLEEDTGDDL